MENSRWIFFEGLRLAKARGGASRAIDLGYPTDAFTGRHHVRFEAAQAKSSIAETDGITDTPRTGRRNRAAMVPHFGHMAPGLLA